tara:strand:- start:14650 stop:15186 length:537 start_codon:yes stop_codon:yes gene_type:complete
MFYHKRGDIISTTPCCQPSKDVFNNWLKEWSKLPYYNKYDLYLTGAFCQNYFLNKNIDTFDIDLFLTGKPKTKTDYYILKNLLEKGIEIGYKNKLLIDIYWRKELPTFKKFCTTRIVTYTEIIYKSDTSASTYHIPGCIKELIPGLYVVEDDPLPNYKKFISKNYELACKRVDVSLLD